MANTYEPPQPGQMRRFAEHLRSQGYSQHAITFAERGAVRIATPFMDPTNSIMNDAQSTVREFKHNLADIDERAALLNRRNYIAGGIAGTLAATLITTEVLFATDKTEDNYETRNDALVTNSARVGLGGISGFMAARQLSGGNRKAALFYSALAAVAVGVGVKQVSSEEISASRDITFDDLTRELNRLQAQEEEYAAQLKAEKEEIRTTISDLTEQREAILFPNLDALQTQRDELREAIQEQQFLQSVHDAIRGTDQYNDFIERGLPNVGINKDGRGGNDGPYTDAVAEEKRLQALLAPIEEEIFLRTADAGNIEALPAEQRQQVESIDRQITSLNTRLTNFEDDDVSARLSADIEQARNDIAAFKEQTGASDEGLIADFVRTLRTDEGFNGMSSGFIFGTLSVAGGAATHYAAAKFSARNNIPEVAKAVTTVWGIPLNNLDEDNYILRNHRRLAEAANSLGTVEGVDHALRIAESAHLDEYRMVLQEMYNEEIIPINRYQQLGNDLRKMEEGLENAMQPWHRSAVVADIAGVATENANAARSFMSGVGEALASTQAAKLASKAASFGTSTPGLGIAFGAGAGGALAYFSSSQKALAEKLHAAGHIDDKALEEYVEMIDHTSAVYGTDIALSTGASFFAPAAIITVPFAMATTGGAEGYGSYAFQQFYDSNNLTHLPQEHIDALSPSLIPTPTVETKFFENIRKHIPLTTEGQPESVHGVIEANAAFHDSMGVIPTDPFSIDPYNTEMFNNIRAAEQDLLGEMAQLGSTREGMEAFLDMFPRDERLKMVRRLSESESDSLEFSVRHPHIAQYATEYKDASLFNRAFRSGAIGADVTDASMNNYILTRLGMGYEPEQHPAQVATAPAPAMALVH